VGNTHTHIHIYTTTHARTREGWVKEVASLRTHFHIHAHLNDSPTHAFIQVTGEERPSSPTASVSNLLMKWRGKASAGQGPPVAISRAHSRSTSGNWNNGADVCVCR